MTALAGPQPTRPKGARAQILAQAWSQAAAQEHASVAVYGRLATELMAAGAPPELISKAHAIAIDKLQHAQVCYNFASGYAGEALGPGPLPEVLMGRPLQGRRTGLIGRLATESLMDGCVAGAETAEFMRTHSDELTVLVEQLALKHMALDYERHVQFAWMVMEWCLEVGAEPVIRQVNTALERLKLRGVSEYVRERTAAAIARARRHNTPVDDALVQAPLTRPWQRPEAISTN